MINEQYKYSELKSITIDSLPVRAFISIENKIMNKCKYAVGVSHQPIMMNGIYLNQLNRMKPLRGLRLATIDVFSIDMNALMGNVI